MTAKPPGSAPLPQQRISTDPSSRPVLIGAIAASLGIIVGSLGPWFTVMVFTLNGLDAGIAGKTALILGLLCGIALVAEFFWGRTNFDPRWEVPIAWAVAVAGAGCLVYAVPFLVKILTIPTQHILGIPISAGVGWGLWLLTLSSAALCVTATILATQIGKSVELRAASSGRTEARLIGGSRWAAIIAALLIAISAIVHYSVNWGESIGGPETSRTSLPSFPSFPSFTMPSFPSLTEPSFPTFTEPSFSSPSISLTPSSTTDLPTATTEPSTSVSTSDGSPITATQAAKICGWLHDPVWTLGQIAMSTGDMLADEGANGPGDNVRAINAAAASTCPDELQRVKNADWN